MPRKTEAEWERIRRRRRQFFLGSLNGAGGADSFTTDPNDDPMLALYINLEDLSGHLLLETGDELLLEG